MPNIKSAVKRVKVIEKKTKKNNMIESECKTAIKNFEKTVAEGNKENIDVAFKATVKKIDQACAKNVFQKNAASHKKSHLSKLLNTVK